MPATQMPASLAMAMAAFRDLRVHDVSPTFEPGMPIWPMFDGNLSGNDHHPGELVAVEQLVAAEARGGFALGQGDVAILDFGWDRYYPPEGETGHDNWWGRNEPGLSEEACRYLADAGIAAVASDTAACDVAEKDGAGTGSPLRVVLLTD